MAIRFDPEYNAEIRRVVKNFNQKRIRAINRGFKYIPDKIYTADIKNRYSSREELNQELNRLRKFNTGKDESLQVIRTGESGKITKWEMDYLESNLKATKEFYQREIEETKKHISDKYPVNKRLYLDELEEKLSKLDLDIMSLDYSQLDTRKRIMSNYLREYSKKKKGFDLWLNCTEKAMRLMNIPDKDIKKFKEKWQVLSPRQFILIYHDSKVVERMYDIVQSPIGKNGLKFTTTDEDAENLINQLLENTDRMIEEGLQM